MTTIGLSADHFQLSRRVRDHAERKLGIMDRYLGDLQRCELTIRPMPHGTFRIDCRLHRSQGEHLAVHAEGESVYAAINLAADKVRTRCRRLHDRSSRAA